MKLHREATIHLIGLFESGHQTAAVCTGAVLSFHSVREACTISAVFSALQMAAVDFNIGIRVPRDTLRHQSTIKSDHELNTTPMQSSPHEVQLASCSDKHEV
jgi:hypothetical protein